MEEIYKRYSQVVYHFLYVKCGNPELAEDLMQETFLRALEAIESYDESCKISTWLCQIAKHLLYQYWEKNNKARLQELEETQEADLKASDDTEQKVMLRLELMDVWDRLQKLPSDMRQVMELRAISDMSYKEIGEMLGKSENWARVTFYRGKMILVKEAVWKK